ncbi:MAG: 50S ribosomal protein L24 [Oscillospiraceae bacterium]|nr:50S ribosomal protein L24 [Oscillospiraceae bacterium]
MKKMHVKRGDNVMVIAGKDKGKEGKIITAIPEKGKVVVEGVAIAKKHQKARMQGQESGIIRMETPIDASNVMRICSKCGQPARPGIQILGDGSNVRYCKKFKEVFND